MKIKLSKAQWEFIGKKTGWAKTAESHNAVELYKKYFAEGLSKRDAALSALEDIFGGTIDSWDSGRIEQEILKLIQQVNIQ